MAAKYRNNFDEYDYNNNDRNGDGDNNFDGGSDDYCCLFLSGLHG